MNPSEPTKQLEPLPFDSAEQKAFLNLWRTYDCLKAIEDSVLGSFDLSAQQYNVLRILLSVAPGAMQTMDLASRMISRSPDMTRMLDRLEKRELVQRTRSIENRRVVEVTLTQAGRKLLDAMESAVVEMHHRQLGHLSTRQQAQLVKLLKHARQPHEDTSCNWLEP